MQLLEATAAGAGAGFAAAILMTSFEAPFWKRMGIKGVVEWQVNQVLVAIVLGEPYDPTKRLTEALTMHLIHGTVIGVILGTALNVTPSIATAYYLPIGVALSLVLWLIAPFLSRNYFERRAGDDFSAAGLLISFGSHLVFGVALGAVLVALS